MIELLESRRLLAAGDLDTTFGIGGASAIRVSAEESITSIHEMPDGNLLVAAQHGEDLELLRLTAGGVPDTTFGGGKIALDIASTGRRLAMSDDGNRIAVGDDRSHIFMLKSDGTRDSGFGDAGAADVAPLLDWGDHIFSPPLLAFTPDGKLIVAATQFMGLDENNDLITKLAVLRLGVDGALDSSFASGGKLLLDVQETSPLAMTINDDGSIMLLAQGSFQVVDPPVVYGYFSQTFYVIAADGSGFETQGHDYGDDSPGEIYALQRGGDDDRVALVFQDQAPNGALYPYVKQLNRRAEPIGATTWVSSSRGARLVGGGIEPGGRMPVILDGETDVVGAALWTVRRFYASGGLDPSYGAGGVANLNLPAGEGDGVVLRDGSVVIAAGRTRGERHDFVLMKVQGGVGHPTVATLDEKGTLRIDGTVGDDFLDVSLRRRDGRVVVRQGDDVWTFSPSRVKRIHIYASAGDDRITIGEGVRAVYIDGGEGRDTLHGTEFADYLVGGAGDDLLLGNAGNDQLFGDAGNDKITGGAGDDYVLGGAGNDRLYGDAGQDILSGAGGNDRLFGGDDGDFLRGGAGVDSAETDDADAYADVERMLT